MTDPVQKQVRGLLDEFGDLVFRQLAARGLPAHASPFYRPFSLVALRDNKQVLVGCSPSIGIAELNWLDEPGQYFQSSAMVDLLENQLGREVSAVVALPLPDGGGRAEMIALAVDAHVREIESMHVLGKLGDIEHVRHLDPYLRRFLEDHPEPGNNVFVMMRFSDTPQMKQIHQAIVAALAARGMEAVRADDRDYTGDLWSNIEVYLAGCQYGIAVFEDVEQRDYNPNVSLELGYLMGRGKRTLLLKEKRLPQMPSDVVHRLYKEFDVFDIDRSIQREVGRWVDVDLGLRF